MKKFVASLMSLAAAAVLFAGCASTTHSPLVLDPVGPPSAQPAAPAGQGLLVVFSAFDVHADFEAANPYQRHYTNYKILSPDGQLVRAVHNDSGNLSDSPADVKLPSGTYRVIAQSNGYGEVTVPVVIAPDQVTVVHLEGGANSWPDKAALRDSNPVKLPDGRIVGWRAAQNTAP
jgi:hypothetical protein